MSKRTNMMRMTTASICLLCVSTAGGQNLTVANFGFEAPATATHIYNPSGGSWTFSPQGSNVGSGVTANNSGFTSANPAAPEGSQVAFLQSTASISQTINGFVPGGTYTISFAAANRARAGYNTPHTWEVQIDGVTAASFANAPTSYTNYTATFTATAASHLLAFVGENSADATVFLDDVTVTLDAPVTGPVFTNIVRTASEVILQGTNGVPQGAYRALSSSDVTQPMAVWSDLGIRTFDSNGNFSFTNAVAENASAFYRLLRLTTGPVFPPVITGEPLDVATSAGNNATFNVTATGTDLTYRWYYNTNTPLAGTSGPSLTLTNVQVSDSGKISVTVSNLLGADHSTFATLTVTNSTEPPRIVAQPGNQNVTVGQTANFSVTAAGALPLRYQWYYNTNTVLMGQTNTTLALSNVQLTNAGNYSVTVTNDFGATNSLFATLTVTTNSGVAIPDGYATQNGGTTGGGNATPTIVTTAAAFRSAVSGTTPRVVVVQGRIDLGGGVSIESNKTIMGADTSSGLYNGTINVRGANYIFQNLTFGPSSGDVMEISGAQNVFVTKCEFYGSTDELCSIVRQADFITVSWSKFHFPNPDSHSFAHLIGNADSATGDRGKLHVTLHHNWYGVGVRGRMPRVRFGHVHLYNNYYNSPGNGYCIGVGVECHIRVENTHFESVNSPWANYGGATNGEIGWAGLKFVNCSQPTFMPNTFPVFTPPYAYTLDPVDNVKAIVTAGAGNVMP